MRIGLDFDDVMLVPKTGVLDTRKEADISSYVAGDTVVNVPIISANMPSVTGSDMATAMWDAGAVGALHRFSSIDTNLSDYTAVVVGGADCICSLGLEDWAPRVYALAQAGASLFLLDVAHGDHERVYKTVTGFRIQFPDLGLIVGNIATASAARRLIEMGVDAVKVGIGPGHACITRDVTGHGVPQLTAIMDVREEINKWGDVKTRLIADGGIKTSGDIVKALAAGADTVMIGSLLAGCNEAPTPGRYYGSASSEVRDYHAPEGISMEVPITGSVEAMIKKLAWGIKSGISYAGATNIPQMQAKAEWIQVRR